MKKQLNKTKSFPIGGVGTSLGLMTLANAWALHGVLFLKPIAIIYTLIALSLMAIKLIKHPKQVWLELKHPVLSSFYPTIDMSAFVLASYLLPYSSIVAKSIWLIGIATHFALFVLFFAFRAKNFTLSSILPSWNVVLVGVCVAGVSGTGMGFPYLSNLVTWFGIGLYMPFYPILLYRIFFYKHKMEASCAATIGILAAPASLVLASYLTTSTTHIRWVVTYLAVSSMVNVVLVCIELPKFIYKGFIPGFGAFTFPLAISIVAMWKMYLLLSITCYYLSLFFKLVSYVELIIGSCIIAYVAIKFAILLIKSIIHKEKEEECLLSITL